MKKLILPVLMVILITAGCFSEKKEEAAVSEETTMITERVRPAAKGGTTAAYFIFKNNLNVADTLLSVKSDVAGMSQVHESFEDEESMMGMREQKELTVGAGEEISFEQGGLHIMLMQLNKNVSAGDSVSLQLSFSQAGEVEITLPVKPQ